MSEAVISNALPSGFQLFSQGTRTTGWSSKVTVPIGLTAEDARNAVAIIIEITGSLTSNNPTQYYGAHMPWITVLGVGVGYFAGSAYTSKVFDNISQVQRAVIVGDPSSHQYRNIGDAIANSDALYFSTVGDGTCTAANLVWKCYVK